MSKYNLIFKISFITYIMALLASPYVSAQIWADILILLFISALLYQLIYLFVLRKKEDQKFTTALFYFFLYGITSISIFILICYANKYINGYTPSDVLGNHSDITYYGIEAITQNNLANLLYIPYLIINFIIIIIYLIKVRKRK